MSMLRTAFLRNSYWLWILLFGGCIHKNGPVQLPYYNSPDFTPLFLPSPKEAVRQVPHTIAPFSFLNQDGERITGRFVEGKIHVANFIFTSCGAICPVLTRQMKRVEKAFEHDTSVAILSYSVTPWIDTPGRLKKYKQENGIIKKEWHFLTGDKAAIYNLARRSYFAEENLGFTRDSTEFLHTEHIVLVDGSKRIRGIYNGTLQLEVEQLIKDIDCLKSGEPGLP